MRNIEENFSYVPVITLKNTDVRAEEICKIYNNKSGYVVEKMQKILCVKKRIKNNEINY